MMTLRNRYGDLFSGGTGPKNDDETEAGAEETAIAAPPPGDGVTLLRVGERIFCCLTVIGQIEGHYALPANAKTTKYEHVLPKLVAIEEDPRIEGLLLLLNTVGGDVEAGLAIAELIAGMKKPTVSLVLGGGHSIGIPLAVSAKRSFVAATATMTVHPVRLNGLVLGVEQSFSYFQQIQERIVSFVCANSGISPERFRALMHTNGELMNDLGALLDGKKAVSEGLIDAVGTLSDAADALLAMTRKEKTESEG